MLGEKNDRLFISRMIGGWSRMQTQRVGILRIRQIAPGPVRAEHVVGVGREEVWVHLTEALGLSVGRPCLHRGWISVSLVDANRQHSSACY